MMGLSLLGLLALWHALLPGLLVMSILPNFSSPLFFVTSAPQRATVSVPTPAGGIELDIYEPARRRPRAVLVIFPAANEQGKDDARLQRLSEVFARAGLRVYLPTLPSINRQTFHPQVIAEMAAVLDFAREREDRNPITVLSFSVGVGPALIAVARAERPPDSLVAFGGYLDLVNLIRFHTTDPAADPFGTWLFARYYAQFLPSRDAAALYEIADRKWRDPQSPIEDLSGSLGPEGHAVLALLQNRDPAAVAGLAEVLPRSLQEFLQALDPRPALDLLQTPVLLLHSRRDSVIPFAESEKLYAALRERGKAVRFLAFSAFDHVNPRLPPVSVATLRQVYLPEFWRLYQAAYQIMY